MSNRITVTTIVSAPATKAWACWTEPAHVVGWNAASDDWHCPAAKNDLRVGGRFAFTMAARDGSFRFDFEGTYTAVTPNTHLAYVMDDGRKVEVDFAAEGEATRVTEVFDPENVHPAEMQQAGWQAILDNYARWVAAH